MFIMVQILLLYIYDTVDSHSKQMASTSVAFICLGYSVTSGFQMLNSVVLISLLFFTSSDLTLSVGKLWSSCISRGVVVKMDLLDGKKIAW